MSFDREVSNPRHVRLVDLFALMTLSALILAMVSPIVRRIKSEDRWQLVALFGAQAIFVTIVIYWEARKRQTMLANSGRRIGVGYCGEMSWRHWPLTKSLLTMLFIAMAQLWFAFAISTALLSLGVLVQQIQAGIFFGMACSRYMWRVFPSSMEFYENGIAVNGTRLVRWNQISVRNSQFFPDRIVVLVHTAVGSIEADTTVVQVSDPLRKSILDLREARVTGNTK